MADLASIQGVLMDLSREVGGIGPEVVRQVAIEVHSECVDATPVDTGLARSNWIASVGSRFQASLARPYAPGYKLGRREIANAQAAKAQARGELYTEEVVRDAYVQNNVAYIGDLNGGYSPQAPANFVDVAILRGVARGIDAAFRRVGFF